MKYYARRIISNNSLQPIKDEIMHICFILSNVPEPSFGADLQFIARDNQQRLNIISTLINTFDRVQSYYKNIKLNMNDVAEDSEYLTLFLQVVNDMIDVIDLTYKFSIDGNMTVYEQLQSERR